MQWFLNELERESPQGVDPEETPQGRCSTGTPGPTLPQALAPRVTSGSSSSSWAVPGAEAEQELALLSAATGHGPGTGSALG